MEILNFAKVSGKGDRFFFLELSDRIAIVEVQTNGGVYGKQRK